MGYYSVYIHPPFSRTLLRILSETQLPFHGSFGVYVAKWIGFVFILENISKSVIHMCKRDGLIQGNLGVGSSICQSPCSIGVIQMLAVFVTHP